MSVLCYFGLSLVLMFIYSKYKSTVAKPVTTHVSHRKEQDIISPHISLNIYHLEKCFK